MSSATSSAAYLQVRGVTKRFGGLTAVKDLTMEVSRGALYGLIGPNGAGKTTVFNLLTGVYDPTEGDILLEGRQIGGRQPFEIAKLGMARTFQNIRLFCGHDGARKRDGGAPSAVAARRSPTPCSAPRGIMREERATRQRAMELLKIFDLDGLADENATSLPYGSQRRLEIARALATEPRVLLLDEPAAGMNPQEAQDLMGLIRWLRDEFALTVRARRAQHEGRDGHLRNGSGHRPRRGDCDRHAGRDPEEPGRHRGVSWRRLVRSLGRFSRSSTWTCSTARFTRFATSRSRSAPARW